MRRSVSRDVLFCFLTEVSVTDFAVSAQRLVEHLKNALQNITTDRTTHSVHERLNFPPPFAVATIPTIQWITCIIGFLALKILQP